MEESGSLGEFALAGNRSTNPTMASVLMPATMRLSRNPNRMAAAKVTAWKYGNASLWRPPLTLQSSMTSSASVYSVTE